MRVHWWSRTRHDEIVQPYRGIARCIGLWELAIGPQ